jgi:hypothetical protein
MLSFRFRPLPAVSTVPRAFNAVTLITAIMRTPLDAPGGVSFTRGSMILQGKAEGGGGGCEKS